MEIILGYLIYVLLYTLKDDQSKVFLSSLEEMSEREYWA